MNYLERIKADLNDPRNCRGMREKVLVDARSLHELLANHEVMDATERALHPESRRLEVNHQLHNLITASYLQQGKNAETTMMRIMDTLRPLMEKKYKEQEKQIACRHPQTWFLP
jgi:CelD/BcsL family acetyltransferase involved in cellulose biosynthesis